MSQTATNPDEAQTQSFPLRAVYERAVNYLRGGRVQDAAMLCAQIQSGVPDFVPADWLMADIALAAGDAEKALQCAISSIEKQPEAADGWFQKARALINQGQFADAKAALEKAISLEDRPAFQLLLANLMHAQGESDAALEHLKTMRQQHPTMSLNVTEGTILFARGRIEEALACFDAQVKAHGQDAPSHFQRARCLIRLNRMEEAQQACRDAVSANPGFAPAWNHLAIFAFRANQYEQALNYANKALNANTKDVRPYLVMIRSLKALNRPQELERILRAGYKAFPTHKGIASEMLGVLIRSQRHDEAKTLLEESIKLHPDDPSMQHLFKALKGETTDAAPEDYVASLFDFYAENFDSHLQESLEYNTPSLLAEMVKQALLRQGTAASNLNLLDLGCGTGLAAEQLRDQTQLRVGVDLSAKMVEQAKEKLLFTEVHTEEIVRYMQRSTHKFDVVTCADVLVYIGMLEGVFEATAKVMKPGGLFAISVEDGDDAPPFVLRPTGRYAHSASYIESLAQQYGFTIESQQSKPIRKDYDKPIQGHLMVLQRNR